MSERSTGATDEQIESAIPRFHAHFGTTDLLVADPARREWTRNNSYLTIDEAAAFLVPPDHAIVGPAELKAIGRIGRVWKTWKAVVANIRSEDRTYSDEFQDARNALTEIDIAVLSALIERTATP